jgi:Tol biopolymer transport system component
LDPSLATRQIAFALAANGSTQDIWIAQADGGAMRQLTHGPDMRFNPSWSPDGQRLAYRVEWPDLDGSMTDPPKLPASDYYGTWVINADGSDNTSISKPSGILGAPASWSPDGGRLAIAGHRAADRQRVYVMTSDGRGPMAVTPADLEAQYPAWSPSGDWIAFTGVKNGEFRIYLTRPDGSGFHQLTDGPRDNRPMWSPDSKLLAFSRDDAGVWIVNADGRDPRQIANIGGVPGAWQEGDFIAFQCPGQDGAIAICAVRPDGSGLSVLLGGMEAGFPAWRPTSP